MKSGTSGSTEPDVGTGSNGIGCVASAADGGAELSGAPQPERIITPTMIEQNKVRLLIRMEVRKNLAAREMRRESVIAVRSVRSVESVPHAARAGIPISIMQPRVSG